MVIDIFYCGLLLILLVILLVLVVPHAINSFSSKTPFIRTRFGVIPEIIQALNIRTNSVLYDLGCGDGRLLQEAVHSALKADRVLGVGIENDWFPMLLARFRTRNLPVEIRYGNLLTASFEDATHIYCYLLPKILEALEPKIIKQCNVGTKIITCDFAFPRLKAKQIINLHDKRYRSAKKLYVYVL